MRTGTKWLKATIDRTRTQPAILLCRHRPGAVLQGSRRTVIDDSGSLAITAWTCAECGELIEEMRILSREGQPEQRPTRYAVAL